MTKVAFVTGASRGIGRSIAIKLLQKGYNVALGYKENLHFARLIASEYNSSSVIQVDIEDRTSIRRAIDTCTDIFSHHIDILINNASISEEKSFHSITDQNWDHMMAVNLRGPFILSQEVLPDMVKNGWGRIINISSIGGQWGGFNQVHYAAAKAGLINLTRSISNIYSRYGITCNAVSPGLVRTDMSKRELDSEQGRKKILSIPVGRTGSPKEVAAVVDFLASEEASYITGQTINVNGGMYYG